MHTWIISFWVHFSIDCLYVTYKSNIQIFEDFMKLLSLWILIISVMIMDTTGITTISAKRI